MKVKKLILIFLLLLLFPLDSIAQAKSPVKPKNIEVSLCYSFFPALKIGLGYVSDYCFGVELNLDYATEGDTKYSLFSGNLVLSTPIKYPVILFGMVGIGTGGDIHTHTSLGTKIKPINHFGLRVEYHVIRGLDWTDRLFFVGVSLFL